MGLPKTWLRRVRVREPLLVLLKELLHDLGGRGGNLVHELAHRNGNGLDLRPAIELLVILPPLRRGDPGKTDREHLVEAQREEVLAQGLEELGLGEAQVAEDPLQVGGAELALVEHADVVVDGLLAHLQPEFLGLAAQEPAFHGRLFAGRGVAQRHQSDADLLAASALGHDGRLQLAQEAVERPPLAEHQVELPLGDRAIAGGLCRHGVAWAPSGPHGLVDDVEKDEGEHRHQREPGKPRLAVLAERLHELRHQIPLPERDLVGRIRLDRPCRSVL